jgi:hypothetical protein
MGMYMDLQKKIALAVGATCLTLLAACGGGSGDAPAPVTPVTPTQPPITACGTNTELRTVSTGTDISFQLEADYRVGQSASIIANILNRPSSAVDFNWQQTSGPSIELANINSPVLPFELTHSGSYEFTLNITEKGASQPSSNAQVLIDVNQEQGVQLQINQDHQVVSGNDVSLRIARKNNQALGNITWCQVSGPTVSLDLADKERPLFKAPTIASDSLIHLKATGDFSGETLSDDVYILTTAEAVITSSYFDTPLARTHSYTDSSNSTKLQPCVYSNQLTQACNISSQLPLIGQVDNNASRAAIMDRVLVSHDWMGENFERFLQDVDVNGDFAKLLQSVTAIVISDDIRPSFYWVVTGAIYLDPENLWLTPAQRDSINEAADYRSEFGKELNFLMPWRYVKNNQYASSFIPKTTRQTRTIAQLTPNLASLLYHELAHANDFFPRSTHASLQGPRLLDDYNRRSNSQALISDQLDLSYPLQSAEMHALANVSFQGGTATSLEKSYQSSDIASFFSVDIANDFYAYSSTREDVAMLFEEAMMSYRLGIYRDVAVTDKPANATADTIQVAFGQRGRVAAPALRTRASYVINNLMPELNGGALLASLPATMNMATGQSWSANLVLPSPNNAKGNSPKNEQQRINGLAQQQTVVPLQLSGEHHGRAQ